MRVLVVEDNESVARFLLQALTEAGYVVAGVADGTAALEAALGSPFDLILLDLMLPGIEGIEVCRRLRGSGLETPILIITARDREEDKIQGLDSGADDYIVKPFQLGELLARVRALLRRRASGPTVLRVDDLELDPATRIVRRKGRTIHLSGTEYALLEFLTRNAGRVLTRSTILLHVWDYDFEGSDNVLDVYISYLRGKLDKGHPRPLIHTVRGVGFRLTAEEGV